MTKRIDLTNQVFGRLTVIEHVQYGEWRCICTCGKEKIAGSNALRSGNTKSCGCLRVEMGQERGARFTKTHGEASNGKETPEYRAWGSMMSRCYNVKHTLYKNYGARNIEVVLPWHTYENFLRDMGRRPSPKHSIDRIDVNGDYEPDNCRWATIVEQNSNTRRNVFAVINGEKDTLSSWCRRFSICRRTIMRHMASGIPIEDAINNLVLKKQRHQRK